MTRRVLTHLLGYPSNTWPVAYEYVWQKLDLNGDLARFSFGSDAPQAQDPRIECAGTLVPNVPIQVMQMIIEQDMHLVERKMSLPP